MFVTRNTQAVPRISPGAPLTIVKPSIQQSINLKSLEPCVIMLRKKISLKARSGGPPPPILGKKEACERERERLTVYLKSKLAAIS